ncbi:GumC family protein [Thalassobellus citreus]|uniref:GumC family protein n=1 Tax=Thalassobellus citreus TaxID=3367752 RepID=UPI0037891AFF
MNLNQKEIASQNISEVFNFKKIISTYTKQWKWFALSLLLAIGIAFFYVRYTAPEYQAYAQIKLLNDSEANSVGAAFNDLSFFAEKEYASVQDEIEVAKSRYILNNVIKKLNLNIQYFLQGRIHETELYDNIPFNINFIASDSIIDKVNFSFYIEVLSEVDFAYKINEDDVFKKSAFGENISTHFGGMVVTPKKTDFKDLIGKTIKVRISSIDNLVQYYKYSINIYQVEKQSRIIGIALRDKVKSKAVDVINTLIDEYNKSSLEEKNIKSKNTSKFISDRIELVASNLAGIDNNVQNFKTGNKLTNITSEADSYINFSTQNEQELSVSRNELNIINYLKNQVGSENSTFQPIPSNVGLSDASIGATVSKYNELLSVRQARLKSSSEKNPIIVNLDQELNALRSSLRQSLNNLSRTVSIKIQNFENQLNKINSKIYAVPGQTRVLRDIEREQGTMEDLYVYLLTKKEEAAISLTATSPNAVVIDDAYGNPTPVFPNKKLIFIAACFIGLLIPFLIIYVMDLLDTKIHNKEDLEKEIKNISILGEIPKLKESSKKDKGVIEKNDRSILSESFRIIRTNFDYLRRGRNIKNYENVVFVTSTIKGEGKSFFSLNTALTIANTNKRVLLIGADIRNPQIHAVLNGKVKAETSKLGFTEYLADKSILVGETINTYNINDIEIDILLSGKIPPNPAELLMSGRVKDLFDYVSNKYDMVIVDTAPTMPVTDTLLISQYAGHTIYLTRADYTEKRVLNFTKGLHSENKLNNMMLVVNDVKKSNFGYGSKYGYYATPEKKSFFRIKY